jgi:hypothetical protein
LRDELPDCCPKSGNQFKYLGCKEQLWFKEFYLGENQEIFLRTNPWNSNQRRSIDLKDNENLLLKSWF